MIDPITITVLISSLGLGKDAVKAAVAALTEYFQQNPEIDKTVTQLVAQDLQPAAKQLVTWVAQKEGAVAPVKQSSALDFIPIEKAAEVASAVEVAARAGGGEAGRLLIRREKNAETALSLLPPEQRVGFGVTRSAGLYSPILLLATENSTITDASVSSADAQAGRQPVELETRVVGFAAADRPENILTFQDAMIQPHRPGRSVAHHQWFAGSLGLYVQYTDVATRRRIIGFVSASHVLSNMNRASSGEFVLSPGAPPDDFLDLYWTYGQFRRGRVLQHFRDQTDRNVAVNKCDVALASLVDPSAPCRNDVPDPNGPDRNLIPIVDVVPANRVQEYIESDVFITGRSTPFAHGRLVATAVREFPVRLPDWQNYMFGNTMVVERIGAKRFSQPGDSGAIIYVLDGDKALGLGFVLGGNERYTFATAAATCLEAMNVRPYVVRFG